MIRIMPAGTIQRTKKSQGPNKIFKLDPSKKPSRLIDPSITQPAKRAVRMTLIGSSQVVAKKSTVSKKFFPYIVLQLAKIPPEPERALGIPSINTAAPTIKAPLARDHPKTSVTEATSTSITEIVEVKAAKTTRIKNVVESKTVPGSLLKSTGRVLNRRPGPSWGEKWKVKIMGKIIKAARIETKIVIEATVKEVL